MRTEAWPVEEGQSQPNELSRLHLKLTEGKNQREERRGERKTAERKKGKREGERKEAGSELSGGSLS